MCICLTHFNPLLLIFQCSRQQLKSHFFSSALISVVELYISLCLDFSLNVLILLRKQMLLLFFFFSGFLIFSEGHGQFNLSFFKSLVDILFS